MSIHEARLIRHLICGGYSERTLASIYYPVNSAFNENFLAGQALVREAANILNVLPSDWVDESNVSDSL